MMVVIAPLLSDVDAKKIINLCEEYDGIDIKGKCYFKDNDAKAEYEDDICDDPKKAKKIKMCN